MKKLCCVFNIPSLYREAIYLDIDRLFECEWYFENNTTDITLFDTDQLKKVCFLDHSSFVGRFYRMKGLTKQLWTRNDFDAYLMIGAPMCISIWFLCILIKLFHPKKKICFWTHGWYGKESIAERIVKKRFLKLADELFVYGNYAKRLLVMNGFKEKRIHVIHNSLSYAVQLALREQMNPTDIYRKHFGNSHPVLIFIGRLTPVKKLDMLLDSLVILNQRGKYFNLIFVGNGIEKESLEHKALELNLGGQVWFYGSCYDEKVNAELIYNADLCVAPGNIGLTAMHVLMFGCPAITHSDFSYQMPEFEAIHPNTTGNFFERDSLDSLVETIDNWFINNSNSRELIRKACFQEIDNSWNPDFQIGVIRSVLE